MGGLNGRLDEGGEGWRRGEVGEGRWGRVAESGRRCERRARGSRDDGGENRYFNWTK
jgi:hypothetical protein